MPLADQLCIVIDYGLAQLDKDLEDGVLDEFERPRWEKFKKALRIACEGNAASRLLIQRVLSVGNYDRQIRAVSTNYIEIYEALDDLDRLFAEILSWGTAEYAEPTICQGNEKPQRAAISLGLIETTERCKPTSSLPV